MQSYDDNRSGQIPRPELSYLCKMIMRRAIPYYKPGGKLCFFAKADLGAWLTRVKVKSQSEIDSEGHAIVSTEKAASEFANHSDTGIRIIAICMLCVFVARHCRDHLYQQELGNKKSNKNHNINV